MQQTFDYYNQYELPSLILCNPDKTELKSLGLAYNRVLTLKYNGLSEFSFTIPDRIETTNTLVDGYSLIQAKRLIYIENIGYFRIDKVDETVDGLKNIKTVNCYFLEVELVQKKLTAFGGTYKLYDPTSVETTLLGKIIALLPTWSLGTIDSALWNKYRTFNVSDTTIYGFLMNDVETAYDCIFVFDTFTKSISAISRDNATYQSDVYLSDQNLIKELNITEITDELSTVLGVYGSSPLDIRNVNPLGTPYLYNFDYYKNTNWMSAGLISALNSWKALIDANQVSYANNLTTLKTYNALSVTLNSELSQLNSDLVTLEGLEKARIEANLPYPDIVDLINAKNLEISAKQDEITVNNANIVNVTTLLTETNTLLSFDNNFTNEQYLELSNFMIENTYQNENFVQTSIMTLEEIQNTSQDLYDQGVSVLERLSQPRYEFSIDAINFIFLKDYSTFTNQIQLGSVVSIEKSESEIIEAVLLEMKINYDNPDDFSLTFSNRLRLDNSGYIYSDLFGQAVRGATSVNFGSVQWADWTNNYQDPVSTFITSSLNTAVNNLINSDNQEILINANGLKGKTFIPETQTYSPEQVWLTSSILAFTNDAWNTAKAALGKISLPDGSSVYGLVADAVYGKLLAGSQLTITNETNNFTLDSSGATLNNAKFNLNDADNKVTITISPLSSVVHSDNLDPGITIQSNISGTWKKTFYVDSSGNAVFAGNLSGASGSFSGSITATSGSIGGLAINSQGIQKDSNNYIRSNGDLKWGALSITGSSAIFEGTIKADKLLGEVQWSQIVNAPLPSSKFNGGSGYSAGGITTGSMAGNRISGGTISNANLSWNSDAVRVYSPGGGQGVIAGTTSIRLEGGASATLVVSPTNISLAATNIYFTGATLNIGSTTSISTTGGNGLTQNVTVSTPSGTKTLRFNKGIYLGYS